MSNLSAVELGVVECQLDSAVINKITAIKNMGVTDAIKTIEGAGAIELAEFLSLFNTVYSYCASLDEKGLKEFDGKIKELQKNGTLSYDTIKKSGYSIDINKTYEHGDELQIISMFYNSPLNINIRGILTALTVAIVISGGEMKMGALEFKVNSLAEAIANIYYVVEQSKESATDMQI